MPQLRQNLVTGEWVVIAPERAKRPSDFVAKSESPVTSHKSRVKEKDCPFCVNGPNYEIRNRELETERIFLIRNKYPMFVPEEGMTSPRSYRVEDDFYVAKPALGDSDVVIVKDHSLNLYTFDQPTWEDLLSVLKRRYLMLKSHPAIEFIMNIYNQGPEAGASIQHPHSQILSSSVITNAIRAELFGSQSYFETNGACVFCDMVRHELGEKVRVLFENDCAISFTFYAARFPFEVWVVPKRHESQFEEEPHEVLAGIGEAMRESLGLLDRTLKRPDLNFFLHTSPTTMEEADYYHWHIEIAPRVSRYGGYELGSGVIIDVVSPEKAAEFLRAEAHPKQALD